MKNIESRTKLWYTVGNCAYINCGDEIMGEYIHLLSEYARVLSCEGLLVSFEIPKNDIYLQRAVQNSLRCDPQVRYPRFENRNR